MKTLFTLIIIAVLTIFWIAFHKTKEVPPPFNPPFDKPFQEPLETPPQDWPCDPDVLKCV